MMRPTPDQVRKTRRELQTRHRQYRYPMRTISNLDSDIERILEAGFDAGVIEPEGSAAEARDKVEGVINDDDSIYWDGHANGYAECADDLKKLADNEAA